MAAFSKLNWDRFDVHAIVECDGVCTVNPGNLAECQDWLATNGYAIHSVDFKNGIGDVVAELGVQFRWAEQFGYELDGARCNLDALRDGFHYRSEAQALQISNADVAYREDADWFLGLLSIAHEYSKCQLAVGRRFLAYLVLDEQSDLLGKQYDHCVVRWPTTKIRRS